MSHFQLLRCTSVLVIEGYTIQPNGKYEHDGLFDMSLLNVDSSGGTN